MSASERTAEETADVYRQFNFSMACVGNAADEGQVTAEHMGIKGQYVTTETFPKTGLFNRRYPDEDADANAVSPLLIPQAKGVQP